MGKNVFDGMSGAYAAMFTPYDAKGCVNPEMISRIIDYGSYRKPFEPLTAAQYRAYAKRFAALRLV